MKILLASSSPRRRELLQSLGYHFHPLDLSVEEVYPKDFPVKEVPAYLSQLKSAAYKDLKPDELLLTADTVVLLDNKILGKPKDRTEAVEILLSLSDRRHSVVTAFTIRTSARAETFSDEAFVDFGPIDRREAEYYVENYHPLDKAGGYGIQEWLGMAKITGITGNYYTIMGLPTHILHAELQKYLSAI